MRQPVLYFFCCFLAFCCLSTFLSFAAANDNGQVANRNRGYVFTAPKRLIAGEKKNVCLSLHNLEPPVHVSVDLLATAASSSGGSANASTSTVDREDDVLASIQTTLKTGIESCMELRVTANTKYSVASLRLRLHHPDYVVEAQKRIFIEHDALVTFVETDKAIYKPGQDVNLRILNLKHDLKPWTKPIPKVWIENPSEVRVAQWTNVSTDNGMAQLSFPLSAEPSSGTWRIKVEKTRPQLVHTSSFEVRKYVLPRFQVTIGAPAYILADATEVTWRVCVRYSYGEPVKGRLLLNLRPQTPIWKRKQTIAEIKYEEQFNGTIDCTNYTVSAQVLGLPQWKVAPNNVVLLANFTEAKSGRVETGTSRSLVMHQHLKLEFAPHTPRYFKPGLPYHGKLRVLKPDGSSPAPNEKIQVCLRIRRKDEWQRSVVECRNFTSADADGFLSFIVPPQHKSIVLLSFVATAVDYPNKYYDNKRWRVFVDQPSAYIDVEPWYSPSSSYLMVTSGYQPVVCGEKYSFNVMYTSPLGAQEDAKPISFHYSINSKSDILVFGHVKYKPRKDALLDYAEFRNVLGANNPKSKSDQSSSPTDQFVVNRFPLSVKITASMAPVSSLLLYYVRPDNEVVSSSHSIEVGQCFDNPVKITWHESRQRPGSMAQFHFEAAPMSLCGISAVDKSTRFLVPSSSSSGGPAAEPHLLEPDSVFNRLKRFHLPAETLPLQSSWAHCAPNSQSVEESSAEEEQEEIDHLPKPVATAAREKRHSVTYNFAANYVDAIQAFDDFGTVVMSDLILESRPCPPWRLSPGRSSMGPMSQEDIDEPDRMLKAVKAMPLAFQFNAPGNVLAESTAATQDTGYQVDPMSAELQTSTIVRSYFPETWIWELIPTGNQGRATIERKLPDTITEWIGKAVCISSKQGLGIGVPSQITAFQPFFLDYSLPYSIKRGEQLHLKVQLFNYMHHPLPVAIRLLKHDGLDLAPSGNQSSVAKFCVPSKDSVVNEFLLLPRDLGELNISVSAEVDSSAFHDCGPKDIPYTRDDIVKPVLVKAEGFPIEVSQSAFLCPKDFSDDSSVVWDLELPKSGEHVVEGSVRAHVSLIGDVLGPALDNLDQLVRLPMGCGEQNMILFVPNIHAIAYLDAISRHEASEIRAKALNNMRKGYQRELNYRHPDGSYSAFGPTDEGSSGSMWLTAFVVKSFAQARGMIQIDERDLKSSVKWIVRRQLENGCFPVVGQVFHKDMKGGLREEGSSALTAYVLISLLESGVPLSTSNTLVNNALYCLEKASASEDFATDDNPYSAVLTTYALALLEHPRANESLRLLMNRASRQNNLVWWEDKSRPSLSLSVEMTAYGVLSLLKLGGEANLMEALRAVRWLCSGKRNAAGGFTSTQDTILGLEALTKFALAMANASTTELSVLVTATDLEQLYKIDEDNRSVLKRIDLPTVPTSLEIFAEGEGCLLVQSSLRYNKAKATGSEAFELTASSESVPTVGHLESNQPQDRCSLQRLNVCARYKLADEESNMALLEIGMVTGFTPERSSLHDLLDEHATGVKRFEENQDTVVIYFDKLTSQKTCISLQAVRENVVDNAEPGNIKLYDYYQQELTVSTSYRFVDPCVKKNDSEKPGHETNEPMPRKMHLDDDGDEEFNNQLSAGEIPRHVDDQALGKVTREKKIDPTVQVIQRPGSTVPSPTTTDLGEGSGAEGGREEQLFSAKPILASIDVVDEGFSPVFVNVDHELDTPNGIEGPVPVYVPGPFFTINNNTSEIISGATTTAATSQPIWTVSTPRIANGTVVSCPRCEDGLPADVEDLFCSSTSVVKVAVRRSRKVRLLLDLSPRKAADAGRLRATMELQMKSECTCAPLDKPGIMALIFGAGEARDYSKATDRARVLLDEDSAMFALTDVVGEPREIERARRACSLFAATRGGP